MRRPSPLGRDSTQVKKRPGREQQTQAVLAAARRLFEQRGFDAVTTAEIAREAKLSRTIIYKYAISKQDILRQILLDLIDQQGKHLLAFSFDEGRRGSSMDDVLKYFEAMLKEHMQHIDLLRLALSESWSWGPKAEGQVTIQLFRVFAPLQSHLRTKYGLELSEPARWALWAVYLEALRTASARYGQGHGFDTRLWAAIFRPQLQLLWPGILAACVSGAESAAGFSLDREIAPLKAGAKPPAGLQGKQPQEGPIAGRKQKTSQSKNSPGRSTKKGR